MIKTAIRCPDDTVMVFDEKGEQIPAYQGHYAEVRDSILEVTPPDTVFSHFHDTEPRIRDVPKEDW